LLETHAAAFTHRSGCEQLDDVDRLDTLRPRFEVAEHLPHALLARSCAALPPPDLAELT
jgi:hypothetical protein